MSSGQQPVPPKKGVEIRTPMRANLSAGQAAMVPGVPQALAKMAGGQEFCSPQFNQLICVEGTVTTTITADCVATANCLSFGLGTCPSNFTTAANDVCTFKFFQELCVQVDLMVTAEASCTIDNVFCGPVDTGPCPTLPTTATLPPTTVTLPPTTVTLPPTTATLPPTIPIIG